MGEVTLSELLGGKADRIRQRDGDAARDHDAKQRGNRQPQRRADAQQPAYPVISGFGGFFGFLDALHSPGQEFANHRLEFLPRQRPFAEKQVHGHFVLPMKSQINHSEVNVSGGGDGRIHIGEQGLAGFRRDRRLQFFHRFFIGFPQPSDLRDVFLLLSQIFISDQAPHVQVDAVNGGAHPPRLQRFVGFSHHHGC